MRRWLALGVVAALVVVAIVLTRDGDDETQGPVLRISRTPPSYRIVYRLEEEDRVSTDRVWVRRPFESRLETWEGAPPGRRRLSFQVSAFGRLVNGGSTQADTTLGVLPGLAASDVRLQPILERALDEGLLQRRERREVSDVPCQVYRSADPLGAGPLRRPTARDYTDSCVTESGLVTEEVFVVDGEMVSRKVAVRVEDGEPFDDELFGAGEPSIPVDKGGGSVQELEPDSRPPGQYWQLDQAPAGFVHRGRYSVIPPQPENFGDPTREAFIRATVADVWVRGVEVLIIDQGGTLRGGDPFPGGRQGPEVDLGALGEGELILDARGAEVRSELERGRFVRVIGTLPPGELIAVARALHAVPGGELRVKQT